MQIQKPWHEDDHFWETVGPVLFPGQRISDTNTEVDQILALLDVPEGSHILDLCCGIGRHSLELSRRGFKVTGVDRTRSYLNEAGMIAASEGLSVEFLEDDMRTFQRPDMFEAVINIFTSFSYFEDPEEDVRVLRNVFSSLKPGGVFVMEMHGKETLARIFRERDWREENGMLILEERNVSDNWSWMENRWIIIKDNRRTDLKLSHRIYSAAELKSLLIGCGFSDTDVYGSLAGDDYDQNAKRMVIVARK